MEGKLFVIGTPIGNLKDITLRALECLDKIEILVCEDTRVTSKLINHYLREGRLQKIPRYFAYNEFNERRVFSKVLAWVREGKKIGLVSDAGMPTISDPGYRVIRAMLDEDLPIEIIPGPTALGTALTWSGIGGEEVLFLGFLPKTRSKAKGQLELAGRCLEVKSSLRVALYVSPYRLEKELAMILATLGDVHAVCLREMTKRYQERREGSVSALLDYYREKKIKGELVLVLSWQKNRA